ncbi:AAA-16 domain-containing protein [Mycena kentingensis (nom. inval.)]|nr:AAA-16 domain-containing protein [Mycena kentingensis (nom. inval.)]
MAHFLAYAMSQSSSANSSPLSQWAALPSSGPPNPYAAAFFSRHNGPPHLRHDAGLELLRRSTCLDSPSEQRLCLPSTRDDVIGRLDKWVADSDAKRIFCVYGPIGVGKSTILRSTEVRLHTTDRLGGSFTFQRDVRRNRLFVTTWAYQVALNVPSLRSAIARAVRRDQSILYADFETQLRRLILRPCTKTNLPFPLVFLVDGLDECDPACRRDVFTLLENAVNTERSPLRIIIASRLSLDTIQSAPVASLAIARSSDAVRAYLASECGRIHHGLEPWFSPQALDAATRISGGCFLTARMLVRFLSDKDFCPTQRMTRITMLASRPRFASQHDPLDSFFHMILSAVPGTWRASLHLLLRVITTTQLTRLSLGHIAQLLGLSSRRLARGLLPHIHALLALVPGSEAGCIEPFHTAFVDFLLNPARSEEFCVVGPGQDVLLVECLLRALSYRVDGPEVNRCGYVAWSNLDAMVDLLTSIEIDAGSVPRIELLLQKVNPDYFFQTLSCFETSGRKIISWLNRMQPTPNDALKLWDDYAYMAFFHNAMNDFDPDDIDPDTEEHIPEGNLLHHPILQRLIRASLALPPLTPLAPFRLLLGTKYEDLRAAICDVLRPAFGRNVRGLEALWAVHAKTMHGGDGADEEDERCSWGAVFSDLALNSLRITRGVFAGRVPVEMMGFWLEWGRFVRSSPSTGPACDEILAELHHFAPQESQWEWGVAVESEVHDVLKWLESLEEVPRHELIRWASYLPRGTRLEQDDAYESRWVGWKGFGAE